MNEAVYKEPPARRGSLRPRRYRKRSLKTVCLWAASADGRSVNAPNQCTAVVGADGRHFDGGIAPRPIGI